MGQVRSCFEGAGKKDEDEGGRREAGKGVRFGVTKQTMRRFYHVYKEEEEEEEVEEVEEVVEEEEVEEGIS